jgi:hypothetical protein
MAEIGERSLHVADRDVGVPNQLDGHCRPWSFRADAGRRMIISPTLASVNVPDMVISRSRQRAPVLDERVVEGGRARAGLRSGDGHRPGERRRTRDGLHCSSH